MLELFYDVAGEIQSNNEDQKKDLETRKFMINTAYMTIF